MTEFVREQNQLPLVSIGIPTYNRRSSLGKALKSAAAQEFPNLEIVVFDNASTDGTDQLCAEWIRSDGRIRYVRHETNLGATANFITALRGSRSEYFMWLADDDWIESGYISNCVQYLEKNSDYVSACGKAIYYHGDKLVREGEVLSLSQDSRSVRLLSFYSKVMHNGMFYGVARRESLLKLELKEAVGGDWLFSAGLAFMGKIATLEGPRLCRSLGGASENITSLLMTAKMSLAWARLPHVGLILIIINLVKDTLWESDAYAGLSRVGRFWLAMKAAATVLRRSDLGGVAGFVQNVRNRLQIRKRLRQCWNALSRRHSETRE